MLRGYTLFTVVVLYKRVYVFFARLFSSSKPTDSSVTAALSYRLRSGEPCFPPPPPQPSLPNTKLTTATVYLLHLIFLQNVSPVEPMLMDMTGGG